MVDPDSCVIFRHDKDDFILKNEEIVLNRYHREYRGKKIVEFRTSLNHECVKLFFKFLQTGNVPNNFKDQIMVFQLLKEWDCHFTVFDSFRARIQTQTKNGFIFHQKTIYSVNIGCLFINSSVFQQFYLEHPNEVFIVNHQCSKKTMEAFLKLIHYEIDQPEIEDLDEILDICHFLNCSSIRAMINTHSFEYILSTIIRHQNEDFFDFSAYETIISENLVSFLEKSDFSKVNLSFLNRVFLRSNCVLPVSILQPFFKNCLSYHGSKASIVLLQIPFQPVQNFEELNSYLNIFSGTDRNDIFSLSRSILGEITQQNENMIQSNYEKDNKIEKLEKLVMEQKKKEEEDKSKIEELMSLLENEKQIIETGTQKNDELLNKLEEQKKVFEKEQIRKKEENDSIVREKLERMKPSDYEENPIDAVVKGKISSIMYLLANGTNINEKHPTKKDYDGWGMNNGTLLHFASLYGNLNVVEFLVSLGSDINVKKENVQFR